MNLRHIAALVATILLFAAAPVASSGPPARAMCAAFQVPSAIAAISAEGERGGVALAPTAAELPQGWVPQGGTSIGGKPAVIACAPSPP